MAGAESRMDKGPANPYALWDRCLWRMLVRIHVAEVPNPVHLQYPA